MSTEVNSVTISVSVVPQDQRLEFLTDRFGVRFAERGEALVFAWLYRLCKIPIQWNHLKYFTLSNDGFYLAPTRHGSECEMSADASGIAATLLALRQLAHESAPTPAAAKFSKQYHELAAFAVTHAEAVNIYRAID